MFKIHPTLIFISLYALTGTFPYLESADKGHTQMMYLSLLNASSIYYIFSYLSTKPIVLINSYFKKTPIFVFFLFLLWTIITIIPAINITSALIQFIYYFLQFISFLCILIFLDYNKKKIGVVIKTIIISLTIIETAPSLIAYIYDIVYLGEPSARSLEYRSITGSLNILAFSLVLKLPFLHYYLFKSNRGRFFYALLIFIAFFVIFSITKTRGAYLFIFISYPLTFLLYFLYNYNALGLLKSIKQSFIFTLLPLIFTVLFTNLIQSTFTSEVNNASVLDRVSTISVDEYSSNSRLRYYKGAINSILENPILGIGTGNWELEGTKRDWANMRGYTVPYHVHNDFLEISAESGILGGFLYFFIIFYIVFKLIKQILKKRSLNKDYLFEIILLISISSYLFDCLLNFPTARPLQQINLFLILAVAIIVLKNEIGEFNLYFKKPQILFLLLLLPLSIYSSLRLYQSSLDQKIILYKYNTAEFSIDKSWLDQVDETYPSLAATSIPIKAFKAYFYMRNGLDREALDLFNESRELNPYVYFTEGWKSLIYLKLNKPDSARYYSQIAYNKIPNNLVHYGHLIQSMVMEKDSIAVKNLFMNHEKKLPEHKQMYLLAISEIIDKDSEGFALNDFNVMEFSGDRNSMIGYYSLKVGYDAAISAAKYHVLGEYAFERKDYKGALTNFKMASELNPFEIPYQENLANTYLQLFKNNEAVEVINEIEKTSTLTYKMRYIRALALISQGDNFNACKDFTILYKGGEIPESIFVNFCAN